MLLITTVISFVASLLAKFLADTFLLSRIAIFGSFAGLQPSANAGVAFSITFPWHLQGIFITVALVLLCWAALHARTRLSQIAFGMIIGGALGNIVDRVFDGLVTDFFQVGTFPIFNVADTCITIGVLLLLLEALVQWYFSCSHRSHIGRSK